MTSLPALLRAAIIAAGLFAQSAPASAEGEVAPVPDFHPGEGGEGAGIGESQGRAEPAPAAVRLAEPVGSVSLALPGDALGKRRYGRKETERGIASIEFSSVRRRPARLNIVGGGGMPSGLPVSGARISSNFGMRYHPVLGGYRYHSGVDLAAPSGTPIRATSDGVVTAAGWQGGYGLVVSIGHGSQVETKYAHMSRLNVAVGQSVKRGEVIGFVGSSGRSTGPHVHYEVRRAAVAVNPVR